MNDASPALLGPIYTPGTSYRARAEARQRTYRANVLRVPHGRYGHLLSPDAAATGANFASTECFEAARSRERAGKGVAPRTFDNMLASQAMCFNVFAPLAARPELAVRALSPFVQDLASVSAIHLEHTPAADVFGDQSALGGVDADLLVVGTLTDGRGLVLVVETKLVEPELSRCGFRKPGRASKGQVTCPEDVRVGESRESCLYQGRKGYAYWRRTDEHGLLADGALGPSGCPFGGTLWQPWVNLALAHEEAARRGAAVARYAVCASPDNVALLRGGEVLGSFRALLRRPEDVFLLDLDALIEHLVAIVPRELEAWADALRARYGRIASDTPCPMENRS